MYEAIPEAPDAKVWFQGMRNCYLAVAERDLLLPSSLTGRLLNWTPPDGRHHRRSSRKLDHRPAPQPRSENRQHDQGLMNMLMNMLAPPPALIHDPR